MLAEYRSVINQVSLSPRHVYSKTKRGDVFLLTGSTGSLGSHLLDNLLAMPNIEHIYCLNRSVNSMSLHTQRNRSRGLSIEFSNDRVTFLTAQLSQSNLGLSDYFYAILQQSVTKIIHNAWPVNFHIPLSSFRPQLAGIINLVRFTNEASHSSLILYISSVSAVSNVNSGTSSVGIVPEALITDVTAPAAMEYGESKYLSERILDYAPERPLLQVIVARVGQILGPIHGSSIWNQAEWFPSLVISSSFVGAVPKSLGIGLDRIDWIPIDVLSEKLLELCENSRPGEDVDGSAMIFNLLNLHSIQ
jgi:thioester reductase-like protein